MDNHAIKDPIFTFNKSINYKGELLMVNYAKRAKQLIQELGLRHFIIYSVNLLKKISQIHSKNVASNKTVRRS